MPTMHVSILTAGTLGLLVGPALGELVLVVDGLLWMVRLGQTFLLSVKPPTFPTPLCVPGFGGSTSTRSTGKADPTTGP